MSLVQSVLLHRSETWTLTKADTARLQAFHVKAQWRILNIKWYDFVTNDSVRRQTKLTDLPLIIADRRHSLLGHVCRLPPDVPAHNILQHCVNLSQGRWPAPDWKRPPGRPRKTWIQQVEEDHGCTIDSLWSSEQDRSLWRSLRPSLVKHSSQWVSDCICVLSHIHVLCFIIIENCFVVTTSYSTFVGIKGYLLFQSLWVALPMSSMR